MNLISAAFVKAQKEFGPALKSSTNPHFKSKYADLAACIESVIDGLNNNGIALVQINHEHDAGIVVETVFIHESGERMSNGRLFVPATKNDAQGYGSALTYARRYSLMAACGIAPEDDDGNAAKVVKVTKLSPPTPDSAAEAKRSDWLDETAMSLQECKTKQELITCWNAANIVMKKMNDADAAATLKPIRDMALDAIEGIAA